MIIYVTNKNKSVSNKQANSKRKFPSQRRKIKETFIIGM